MKKTDRLLRVITVALIGLVISATQTRAAVTVYGDEISNAPAVTAAPSGGAETNASDASAPRVKIDATGIHVGGPKPVDINLPTVGSHPERAVDVVGIVAVVFGCMVPITIVATVFYFRHRRLRMHHETMRMMIDKGQPIPPEMIAASRGDVLMGSGDVKTGRSDLRGGLILIAVGAGLLMFVGKVGWILVFIGAARLVLWLMDSRS